MCCRAPDRMREAPPPGAWGFGVNEIGINHDLKLFDSDSVVH